MTNTRALVIPRKSQGNNNNKDDYWPIRETPAFPLAPEVTTEWQRAIKPDRPYRFLQLQFQGETLHLVNKGNSSPSAVKDFESMKEVVSEKEACYLLFRVEDSNSWSLISYVPEDAITKTQEKMMYAVAKSALKTRLGVGYFTEDWHVNAKKQLTYINYKNETTQKADAALSETEKIVLNGIQEEEHERQRQMSTPNPSHRTALNQVDTALKGDFQSQIQRFKDGSANFVRMAIDASENAYVEETKRVSTLDEVRSSLAPGIPGYYLFSLRPGSTIFLYYCPDKSPHNTRLVYATRMKSVREKVTSQFGVNVSKTIEMQDAKDLDSLYNNKPSYESPAGFKEHRAAASPKIDKPHPLFGGQGAGPKKKVVIPPPAAYQ